MEETENTKKKTQVPENHTVYISMNSSDLKRVASELGSPPRNQRGTWCLWGRSLESLWSRGRTRRRRPKCSGASPGCPGRLGTGGEFLLQVSCPKATFKKGTPSKDVIHLTHCDSLINREMVFISRQKAVNGNLNTENMSRAHQGST